MNFFFDVHPTRREAQYIYAELRDHIMFLGQKIVREPKDADFCVAIGGDGTMVSAFRKCSAPVIGINAGTLGYLPRVEPEDAREAIELVLEGKYSLEERMTLSCGAPNERKTNALNEAALLHADAGVIRFTVLVDGLELISYTADGMIAATPTGSTGYSLSAGGPIVDPTSEMLILTPIAPHTLVSRPIILSAGSRVTLVSENDALIACDGQTRPLKAHTPYEIQKSPNRMRFVTFGRESFISRLRKKLV